MAAQGGNVNALGRLEHAPDRWELRATRPGVLARIDALKVGQAAGVLGGGRSRKDDSIDMGVGVELHAKVGDPVAAAETVATVYHRAGRGLESAQALLSAAVQIADEAPAPPLVIEVGIGG